MIYDKFGNDILLRANYPTYASLVRVLSRLEKFPDHLIYTVKAMIWNLELLDLQTNTLYFYIASIRPTYTYVENPFTGLRNYPSISNGCIFQVSYNSKHSFYLYKLPS